jgi:hypothetical protein
MRWITLVLALPVTLVAQQAALPGLKPLPNEKDITSLWPRTDAGKNTAVRKPILAMVDPRRDRATALPGESASGVCSIPLIEVRPPSPNGRILRVPAESHSGMPVIPAPAPPCTP